MFKSVNFVIFTGYLQCEFKSIIRQYGSWVSFPDCHLRLAAVWEHSMHVMHKKTWTPAICLWPKVYIFGLPGLDLSRLSIHANCTWDFSLWRQVRSLSEKLFTYKQYGLKTSLNNRQKDALCWLFRHAYYLLGWTYGQPMLEKYE